MLMIFLWQSTGCNDALVFSFIFVEAPPMGRDLKSMVIGQRFVTMKLLFDQSKGFGTVGVKLVDIVEEMQLIMLGKANLCQNGWRIFLKRCRRETQM